MIYDYGSETNNLSTRSTACRIYLSGCTEVVTRGNNRKIAKMKPYKPKKPTPNPPFSNQPRDLFVLQTQQST